MLNRATYVLLFSIVLVHCSEKEFDPNDPSKSFVMAREPYDDRNFDMALTKLGEFKSRFPYSQYASDAELLIAHSHFELDHYPEATAAYTHFIRLHPTHKDIDLAMFRIAQSYWEEAPEEIDREQEYTAKAVKEWEKLIVSIPHTKYAQKAKKLIAKGKLRMAKADEFVAAFYCRQEIWHACAYRYLKISKKHDKFLKIKKRALENAANALDELAVVPVKASESKNESELEPKEDQNIFFKNMSREEIKSEAQKLRLEARGIPTSS